MNANENKLFPRAESKFAASGSSDARLTVASMMALISTLPPAQKWTACTARPEHIERLRAECRTTTSSRPTSALGDTLFGIRLYPKLGQMAYAWMFSDDAILRKYLNDELSELDLMALIETGACHPNE